MNRIELLQSKRKGSSMVLVLIAVVVLSVMGVGMLRLGQHSRLLAVRTASEIAARCAADAGLAHAISAMNDKLKAKSWSDKPLPKAINAPLSNFDATFAYTITGDSDTGFTVESIGEAGQAIRTVTATLRLQTPFEYAIFMQGDIILKNGTTIDWYNYDADDEILKIGTDSTDAASVIAKTGVTINGDVIVGFDGDPDVVIDSLNEAVITGEAYAAAEDYEMPPVTVPQSLENSPSKGTLTDPTTIIDYGKYDSIRLGNSEIMIIDRPVTLYVLGDVILDNSAQIQIADVNTSPDASFALYLGGNFLSQNGGIVNNLAKDANKVKIYGLDTCQNIDFKTNSVFYGAIYAPNADVRLHNSVEVFGSVVADSFIQDVNANFHYDASLRDASTNDEGVRFVVKWWSEE
jgi:hypothetical protein